jgi:hypothetical protein
MMTRLSQHGGWNCELENRAKEILLGRYITNFAEEFEFAAKGSKGKPCGESYISASYNCTLEAGERARMIEELGVKGELKKRVEALNDVQLSRVVKAAREKLSVEGALRASRTIDTLTASIKPKSESDSEPGEPKRPPRKKEGDNLQHPEQAAKYAEFYRSGKDKTYKPPYDTSPEEVEFVIQRMRAEGTWGEINQKLSSKGTPQASMKKEAWGDEPPGARGKAILKSLMDNDFKDVLGNELPWDSGMQLDHRLAGSMGGKDTLDNWIWVGAATNQVKGSIERTIQRRGLKGQEAEDFLRKNLITKLRENARMTPQSVIDTQRGGTTKAAEKAARRQMYKENMPLYTQAQLEERLSKAKGGDLKDMMQGSLREGFKGAAFLKKGGTRGQTDYPGVGGMRAMIRMRWGYELGQKDLQEIAKAISSAKYDIRPPSAILEDALDRFGPPDGLSSSQKKAILDLV